MKKKNVISFVSSVAAATTIVASLVAVPVSAATQPGETLLNARIHTNIASTSMNGEVKGRGEGGEMKGKIGTNLISRKISNADKEIQRRIDALNKLASRIAQMKKVTDAQKANLTTLVQNQITAMTTLKAKIDADTATSTLQTDVKSITDSYRIYMLILPQIQILAAADRAETIVDAMNAMVPKIQAAITTAQNAGKDVSGLQASLADFNAKVADANTQAQAAITAVASLTPDNGDSTVAQSNKTALMNARADIKKANQDLQAARKDAGSIVKGYGAFKLKVEATSTETSDHGENN